jgi:catechol 2,3-dioxygenase-like lactoylglutathione lyase family enzyme
MCLCRRGDAALIAGFYRQLLGAETSASPAAGEATATIAFGGAPGEPKQLLTYVETEELPEDDGHHLALYFRSHADFLRSFERVEQAGLLFVNTRFADRVNTREGAETELQFRFRDLVDLSSGRLLLTLEHEVRSPLHPSCPFGPKVQPPSNA